MGASILMTLHQALQQQIERAATSVARARHVTALVGAGMSAESGVPTFRGPQGLWTKYGEPDLRDYDRFRRNPKTWWEERQRDNRMGNMRGAMEAAQPNPGHHALVALERMGVLRYIITQNVDNLHRAAGSRNVAEIHGNWTLMRCVDCGTRFPREQISLEVLPPLCPRCNGVIKGDTVMFGEPIPADVLEVCQSQALLSDCMLILGTSGVVYPAAALPGLARRANRALLIEINPEETALTDGCDAVIRAPTGEVLPMLAERVRQLHGAAEG